MLPTNIMERLASSEAKDSDDKYDKRRSQHFRCRLRCCFAFFLLALMAGLRTWQRSIFQYIHDHHLQSYTQSPYIRGEYSKWLREYRNSPLIPRMLPGKEVAFDVLNTYEETKLFFKEATPPYLVLYYANWCPHSATAIPVIQEFAKTVLQPNRIRLVAIEESNPFSDAIPGFPTVYLWIKKPDGGPAVQKEFKLKMKGRNLLKFLQQNIEIAVSNETAKTT